MNDYLYSMSAITDQICIEIQLYNLLCGLQIFDIVFQQSLMNSRIIYIYIYIQRNWLKSGLI